MKVLWLTTSTNNTATFHGSLESLGTHEVQIFRYDQKFYEQLNQMVQANPGMKEQIERGMPVPMSRDRAAMDSEILLEAKISKPDVIIYVSAWTGHFVPLNETLGELNSIAPLVHFLCDGQDPPWREQLYEFDRRGVFRLTVNIDGGHRWPGGADWTDASSKLKGDCLTLLTPIDPRSFRQTNRAFVERPFLIGYSGSPSSSERSAVINRLQRVNGFNYRARDNNPMSYADHIAFLQLTQVSVNIPFTGSGMERHVKGRVLESGFAGCCLLEWQSDTMRTWFTPRLDYEEFSSVEEAAEMAEWLAHHPGRAEDMGRALAEKCFSSYSPKNFWSLVLGAVA